MEFVARIDYNKEYFLHFFKNDHRFDMVTRVLSVIAAALVAAFIYWITRFNAFFDVKYYIHGAIFAVVSLFFVLYSFNYSVKSAVMFHITKALKRDGEYILIFNEQGLTLNSLKYSKEKFFPMEEFKSIEKKGKTFKIHIDRKLFHIKPSDFEIGNDEEFHKWLISVAANNCVDKT